MERTQAAHARQQHLLARDAKLGLKRRLHRDRVADVAVHGAVRHTGGDERFGGFLLRGLVVVDAAHDERMRLEVLAAQCVLLDVPARRCDAEASLSFPWSQRSQQHAKAVRAPGACRKSVFSRVPSPQPMSATTVGCCARLGSLKMEATCTRIMSAK